MPIFVIQEHHAKKLHWDFRLESGGKLKSWAVPKQPPSRKGLRRLAIEVPDHNLSYAKFQGEIKDGYGKGTVKIWDNGNYSLIEKTPRKIIFNLQGKKLKGKFALVKADFKDKKDTWLLMKLS